VLASIGLMHGRYRSSAGRSKLAHHAVCSVRPIIVGLMNYCYATLAIIMLSPSVSATVHSIEIIYLLKFLTLRNSSYHSLIVRPQSPHRVTCYRLHID